MIIFFKVLAIWLGLAAAILAFMGFAKSKREEEMLEENEDK